MSGKKRFKLFERIHLSFEIDRANLKHALNYVQRPLYNRHLVVFLLSVLLAAVLVYVMRQNGHQEVAYMSGIFVLAALLWVTEALPLFSTSLLIIGLEILFLANPGNWAGLGFESQSGPTYKEILAPFADPILFLFLGGFILARAAVKEGVDKALASSVLSVFGGKPSAVVFGLMVITAGFSMFMSNTATTAMMITLVAPLIIGLTEDDPLRIGLVLCIPIAANIGGMGTPIGSPPNAVAIGFLRNEGLEVNFLDWMIIAVPLVIIVLVVAWALIVRFYKSPNKDIVLKASKKPIAKRGYFVVAVFTVTILMWLTDQWHGLPSAVTAMFPIVVLTATGIIDRQDYNSLEWHILALIAGGIALGLGIKLTGLDLIIVSAIPTNSQAVFFILVLATVVLSIFMSNTAAANLIIPLAISLAIIAHGADSNAVVYFGLSIALASSLAMALPISTPPNAIAFAQGTITSKDFIKMGIIVGVLGVLLIGLLGPYVINYWLNF